MSEKDYPRAEKRGDNQNQEEEKQTL